MSDLEFRKIDGTDYENELIALFNSVFGRHATQDTWEYKHHKNTFSRQESLVLSTVISW